MARLAGAGSRAGGVRTARTLQSVPWLAFGGDGSFAGSAWNAAGNDAAKAVPGYGIRDTCVRKPMIAALHTATVLVYAVAMALAVAHALEMPGKMRLPKETYFAVQRIYYPGFTIGGISEPVALLLLLALFFMAPRASASFRSAAVALAALIAMQVVYWVLIHPVNKVWMQGANVRGVGSEFLKAGGTLDSGATSNWQNLRNRWEYAHAARAVFALLGFIALVLRLPGAA